MNIWRCIHIASFASAAAALVLLCAGCDQPVITIQEPPVYRETLVEVAAEPADETVIRPVDPALRITFDDLNLNLQPDIVFQEEMLTDAVKQLTGKRVSLTGVMLDTGSFQKGNEFILLRNKEHPRGKGFLADHLISVQMRSGETAKYTAKTVRITGTLHIEPVAGDDGVTWVIYVLKDATVAGE